MFESSNIKKTGFIPPVSIIDGLRNTINYEFINKIKDHEFYTE